MLDKCGSTMFISMWVILVMALQLMAVGLASEYHRLEERDVEGAKGEEEVGDDTLDTAVAMQLPEMASGRPMTAEHRKALLRLRHIEKAYNLTQFNPDFDDMNHLEYYWHEISHFVKSSVPPTDEQCYFNVTAWRCFPVCQCSFQPRPGDYTPSRSCRLSDDLDRLDACLEDYHDEAWLLLLLDRVQDVVGSGLQKVREGIPETDHECSYEFRTNRCLPEDRCSFQWRLGDLLPARACRLRDAHLLDMDGGDEDELERWMADLLEGEGEGDYNNEGKDKGEEKYRRGFMREGGVDKEEEVFFAKEEVEEEEEEREEERREREWSEL